VTYIVWLVKVRIDGESGKNKTCRARARDGATNVYGKGDEPKPVSATAKKE